MHLSRNVFLTACFAHSVCGLIHLFVTLLSVTSELVNKSLVGSRSAKPGEVWKNKCDLGRIKALLWQFNKRHSNRGQVEEQMQFVLSFSYSTLSTVL